MVDSNGTSTRTLKEMAELLLGTFFSRQRNNRAFTISGPITEYGRTVDVDGVKAAIWRMGPGKAPGTDGVTAGVLRKAWPILAQDITHLFSACIEDAIFPEIWKDAKLVVRPKPEKTDRSSPKSYRPVSLLPALAKALETLIIQDLEEETGLNDYGAQHGFVPGRSTITAMKNLYNWVDDSRSRHVIGVFLDITGAFDNVGWFPVLSRLNALGASLRTIRMVQSYLRGRSACLTLEKDWNIINIERGCPQGSQLGPTLLKVAMTSISDIKLDESASVVLYADDIALLVGAARPQTAQKRIEGYLEGLKTWATEYELTFSPAKSQMISIKGGLKPGYTVGFGTEANAPRIVASGTARYLGVILDPRRSY